MESAEWKILENLVLEGVLDSVGQLLLEVHLHWAGFEVGGDDPSVVRYWFSLLKELERANFRLFHVYSNPAKPHLFLHKNVLNASSAYTLSWVNTGWRLWRAPGWYPVTRIKFVQQGRFKFWTYISAGSFSNNSLLSGLTFKQNYKLKNPRSHLISSCSCLPACNDLSCAEQRSRCLQRLFVLPHNGCVVGCRSASESPSPLQSYLSLAHGQVRDNLSGLQPVRTSQKTGDHLNWTWIFKKRKKLKWDVKTSEDPALSNVNGYLWEDKEREGMQVMKEKVGSSVEAEDDGGGDGTDAAEHLNNLIKRMKHDY